MRMRLQGKAAKAAASGLLLAAAILLSYIESILGLQTSFLPGMKLGLANVIVTFAFFEVSASKSAAISFCRLIIIGMLFGSPISFLYSLCGAILSFGGLYLSRRLGGRVSYIGVSVICACLHNVGQTAVAACFFGTAVAAFYLPYLLISGAVFGAVTGFLLNFLSNKYKEIISK